ncbi:MAG: hypothetical protein Q7U75_15745 [Desulfobacterales bacterium]|nr:hypothetical protein [Desulfobacterales bacterium]
MFADMFSELERTLPPVFARTEVPRLFPGMISSGRLANLDYLGRGPRKVSLGRKVGYTRGDFIAWMRSRNAEGI